MLVEECGCRDDPHRYTEFLLYLAKPAWGGHEFRFQGALGFGGKFYNDGRVWRVGCYGEDRTPERLAMIARANVSLAALKEERDG